jgi:O-antigen/teichoic acid export membrane protein
VNVALTTASRPGALRAALTVTDQLVGSAATFLLGVVIARAGGSDALGAFGIAFLIWLAVLGTNRALVAEPMIVTGSTDQHDAQLPEGLLATVLVGIAAACVVGLAGAGLALTGVDATTLLALAACLPSLLAHDFCRSAAFRLQRPDRALAGDVTLAVVQGAATLALLSAGVAEASAYVAAWGAGATCAALVGIGLAHIRPVARGGLAMLRRLWSRSRWFLAEFSTAFPAEQGYLLLLPLLIGTAQFGLYRAAVGLIGPIVVVFVASGNIGLPAAVRRLRDGGVAGLAAWAPRFTLPVLAVTVLYCAAIAVFAEQVLALTYGPEFVAAATVTRLVAVQYVLVALCFGYHQAVKAAGMMRLLWATRAVSAAVSIAAVVVLTDAQGLTGAGLAGVTTGLAYVASIAFVYRRLRRPGDPSTLVTPGPRHRVRSPRP